MMILSAGSCSEDESIPLLPKIWIEPLTIPAGKSLKPVNDTWDEPDTTPNPPTLKKNH